MRWNKESLIMIFVFSFCVGIMIPQDVHAANYVKNKVVITCDLPSEVIDYELKTNIHIEFLDSELFNPGVKLSYKIYDQNMNPISIENSRVELEPVEGIADVYMDINLKDYGVEGDNVIIRFDLVDETNLFWFGENPYIEFDAPEIHVNYNFFHDVKMTYINIVINQYIQLIINLVGVAFIVYGIKKLYHNVLALMN